MTDRCGIRFGGGRRIHQKKSIQPCKTLKVPAAGECIYTRKLEKLGVNSSTSVLFNLYKLMLLYTLETRGKCGYEYRR